MIGPPIDVSGRGPSTGVLTRWGIAAIAVLAAIAIPVTLYARGVFDDTVEVTVTSDRISEGLSAGADVKYQGLLVGHVESITIDDQGHQRMRLAVDATQADHIGGHLTATFAPSNIFGVTGVELTPTAPGPALRNGQIIAAQDDSSDVSAVSVLRDIGSISSTLTGSEVTAMINRLDEVVTQISPLMRSGFDLFALAHQHQQMPFAQMLRIADDTLRGAAALSDPFVNLFTTLVEKTAMYADPQETAKVTGALTGLVQTFITLGQVVGTDPGDLATVLDASLTLGAPLGYTLSTVPAAADDAHELIGRLDKMLPRVDGTVRLRLGLTLESLPAITSALPTAGAVRTGGGGR
ncbi:MCE family protein [Gordonia sp. N1V]|uniref:MlaD family protein n=1 Tax=Gordonia sp. N1V TaxID=3034163 RepID=UPI0023E22240|nr:MCE family protein [Gordonia sp. N1V]MDF3285354.1 MlaD family protein [Gordonia sp. N1V]